ncbi:uncharacterized protein L203_100130 [Cryptococcus depauperatus CBS 7841]|uniref:Uncharacterized protein n=1 Tax=Cryptococcus depauperatus CBS 7841 TaxID=1295531 RepID=A0A1E3IZL6_9TREE|nr:hypothetical protein L203_00208 [Cryptococcus depauperatus CBS 7841]
MNDPLFSLAAPPPRYRLESDSSDEEGEGIYPGGCLAGEEKVRRRSRIVSVRLDAGGGRHQVVVGVGQAGRYLVKHMRRVDRVGDVTVDGREVGWVYRLGAAGAVDECLVVWVDVDGLDHGSVWRVAEEMVRVVQPGSLTMVTAYPPSMVITSDEVRGEPPIRYLSARRSVSGVAAWEAPNVVSGLAGALMSLSVRAVECRTVSAATLLLPLPLSSLSWSSVVKALSAVDPGLADGLAADGLAALAGPSVGRWTENDDERYSAPGMGRVHRVDGLEHGDGLERGDAAGMYT